MRCITVAACAAVLAAAGPVAAPRLHPLSTEMHESGLSTTRDGRTAVYTVRLGPYYRSSILIAKRQGARWGEPVIAPFSGSASYDVDGYVSPDGTRILFASNRSVDGTPKVDFDLFEARLVDGRWTAAVPIAGVNSPVNELSPTLGPDGVLYFASRRSGGGDIFRAVPIAGGYDAPEALPATINGDRSAETGVTVSADGRMLVIASTGRSDEGLVPGTPYPRGDLYISRRSTEGWSAAVRMAAPVNSFAAEANPIFAGDGRTLRFTSERGFATEQSVRLTPAALQKGWASTGNGLGDLYEIGTTEIVQ